MLRIARLLAVVVAVFMSASGASGETLREAQWARVVPTQELPEQLTSPEGRTRWDLSSLELERSWTRTLESDPEGTSRVLLSDREPLEESWYGDPSGGDGARRWLLPDHDESLLAVSGVEPIRLVVERSGGFDRMTVEVRRVGVGWLHLPSGPREVVLQRALVADGRSESLVHRWIDPRTGVVAEIWGPASSDGRSRLLMEGAAVVEKESTRAKGFKIYAEETDHPIYFRLGYGYDRGPANLEDLVAEDLDTDGLDDITDLVTAGSWDFSVTNSGNALAETASTTTPIDANETCSWNQCGFNRPGAVLGREDMNFDDPENLLITVNAMEREDSDSDGVTIWLRGVVKNEGVSDGATIFDNESRLCYVDDGRSEVPLWRFSHRDTDTDDWYMEINDSWANDPPFACEQNIFSHVCPNSCGYILCQTWTQGCTGPYGTHAGTQSSTIVGEGLATLPSGHTFNTLVIKTVADFCTYAFQFCSSPVVYVRTVVTLWEAPHIGTVVRLMSAERVDDADTFTSVVETDIKFGLFPPLSVTVDTQNITDHTMPLSWDPGLVTDRIDGYKVYWDTETGGGLDGYDNSLTQMGAGNTSATLTSLDRGTQYFVTVTSLSDFTDPASGITTTYESLLYPTTMSADPSPLPIEAIASTTCTPADEIGGVMVGKPGGTDIRISWSPSTDLCLTGYQILGADTPELETNFSPVVEDTGLVEYWDFDPTESYFLVLSKGTGGTGPWGHTWP
jgi:hypothetical protein